MFNLTAGGRPWRGGRHPGRPSGFEARYRAVLAAGEESIPKDKDEDYECWVPCAPSPQKLTGIPFSQDLRFGNLNRNELTGITIRIQARSRCERER